MEAAWVAIGSVAHAVAQRESQPGYHYRRGEFTVSHVRLHCGKALTTEVFGDLLMLAIGRTRCPDCWEVVDA